MDSPFPHAPAILSLALGLFQALSPPIAPPRNPIFGNLTPTALILGQDRSIFWHVAYLQVSGRGQ